LCRKFLRKPIKLTNASLETLVTIAYFQPVTRPEIERIRGVTVARAILDLLLWSEWIRPGPRRQTPGNPLTFVATNKFLQQFDLKSFDDLPDIKELRDAGILNADKDIGVTLPGAEIDVSDL
jgi:segregation and condensation protein B